MQSVDIVIPTLHEGIRIQKTVERLHECKAVKNIIVVDGGDGQAVKGFLKGFDKVTVLKTRASRGFQQSQGAKIASSDIILFLHADVVLPESWPELIINTLSREGVAGGAFQIKTVADPECKSWADRFLFLADFRSKYARYPYGDQCLFIRREVFVKMGGYPDQPLFEDLEFSKSICSYGKIFVLKEKVMVSGRRMQKRPLRSFFYMNFFPILYRLGVPPDVLRKWYS